MRASRGPASAGGGGGASAPVIRDAYVTSGDILLANSLGAWAAVPGMTLAVPATTGQRVQISIASMWDPAGSTTQFLDVAITAAGVPTRYASNGTITPAIEGWPAMYTTPSSYIRTGATCSFVVGAGDISGGNVTFTLMTKGGGTGKVFASVTYPWYWLARAETFA